MKRCFVLDVAALQRKGLTPGAQGDLTLRAALMAWPLHARYMVRGLERIEVTLAFDSPLGGGVVHLSIDMPTRGSHRHPYFVCPESAHAADAPVLVGKLYWPVGDQGGFESRTCHRLAYASTRDSDRSRSGCVKALASTCAEADGSPHRTSQPGRGPPPR